MQTGEEILTKENSEESIPEDELNYDDMSMAELLEQSADDMQTIKKGNIIKGAIVSIASNEILVDVGSKYEGVVKSKDLERLSKEYIKSLQVGDVVHVYVIHLHDDDGYVILSLNKALIEQDWERAQKYSNESKNFEGDVVSTNKGGLIINFGGVRGFVPGSQLDTSNLTNADKANQWAAMVGRTLWLKIIEVDRRRNRLILSERAAVDEVRQQQKAEMLAKLTEGEVLKGRVSSLADFGAFVEIGGAEGLIHLSELSWTQVSHPRDVLKTGDEINVYILNIDHNRLRVGLSLKRLQPEPWSQALDNYQPGQIVDATITKLTNFGAFARIDNTLEGLIHISELAHKQINHPRDVVSEKEKVQVRIISIEPERRRMGLSLKQVVEPEEVWDGEEESSEGDAVETPETVETQTEEVEAEVKEAEAEQAEVEEVEEVEAEEAEEAEAEQAEAEEAEAEQVEAEQVEAEQVEIESVEAVSEENAEAETSTTTTEAQEAENASEEEDSTVPEAEPEKA